MANEGHESEEDASRLTSTIVNSNQGDILMNEIPRDASAWSL